jgi:hypothetical protein
VPTYTGLLLGLGSPTDRPIDAWEEGFIPMELMKHLRAVSGGRTRRAVRCRSSRRSGRCYQTRAPPPGAAPARTAWYLLAGLLLGGGVRRCWAAARRSRRAALRLALAITVWGVVTGFFGVILTLLWVATNHIASYAT